MKLKKRHIFLFLLFVFLISSCVSNKQESKNQLIQKQIQEKTIEKNETSDSTGNIPESFLREECEKYPWPEDCSFIPDEEGIKFCKKCRNLGVGSTMNFPSSTGKFPESGNDNDVSMQFSGGRCKGKGSAKLSSIMKIEDIGFIEPTGTVKPFGGHVTPVDHQYYHPIAESETPQYNVYSPMDGNIVSIQHFVRFIGENTANAPKVDDYRVVIEHSCTFYIYFIHIKELSQKIMDEIKSMQGNQFSVRIPVKEGEIIGKVGKSFDFAVIDTDVTLKGFIVPKHYEREAWKIHTVDPFDYFKEPIRTQLLSKNLRTAEPFGGKIDYDIDGKLIGNWFVENTNGYEGIDKNRYWSTHIAILYDTLDPSHATFSLGTYEDHAEEFGVKANAPDPANVGIENGLVKYEIVPFKYTIGDTGRNWDRRSYAKNIKAKNDDYNIQGTILVQLISDRKLKVEIFPNKRASEVPRFTNDAIIYER